MGLVTGAWQGTWSSTFGPGVVTVGPVTVPVTRAHGVAAATLIAYGSTLTGSASVTDSVLDIGSISGTVNGTSISFGVASGSGVKIQFNGTLSANAIDGTYQGLGTVVDVGVFHLELVPTPGVTFPGAPSPSSLNLTAQTWTGDFATQLGTGVGGNITFFDMAQDQDGFLGTPSVGIVNGGPFTFGPVTGSVLTQPPFLLVVDESGSGNAILYLLATIQPSQIAGVYQTIGSSAADTGTFTLTRY
jgi:hypothetical protein